MILGPGDSIYVDESNVVVANLYQVKLESPAAKQHMVVVVGMQMQGGFSYQDRITPGADAVVFFQFTFSGSRNRNEGSPMNREVLISDEVFHMFRARTL